MSATVLHLVTRSPFDGAALEDALRCSGAADAILLLHDAVLAAPVASALPQQLVARMGTRHLYALAADLAARGLAGARIRQGVQIVDDAGFVALAAVHRTSVSWA